VVGDRPKHDDDAFSPQWGINFRIVDQAEVLARIGYAGITSGLPVTESAIEAQRAFDRKHNRTCSAIRNG